MTYLITGTWADSITLEDWLDIVKTCATKGIPTATLLLDIVTGVKVVLVEHGGESRCSILRIYLRQMVTIKGNGNYTAKIIYGYHQQSAIVQLTSVHLKKNMPVM